MGYNVRLTRKGNKLNVKHVTRNVVLKRKEQLVRLVHAGARGIPGPVGPQGPEGPVGPQGEQGEGIDKYFAQDFTVTDTVLIEHNLEKLPAVTVIDSANDEVQGEVVHLSTNSLLLRFGAPFSGKVTCN